MGKQIYLKKVGELFDKSPVVDFKSIDRVVKEKSKSNYAKLLVSNLLKNGKIRKVSKGYYTKYEESSLSVFCFKPAYLGLHSALSFHKLWDQATIPVILTTRNVRTGRRDSMGGNIIVRHISKKYLFGFDYYKDGSFYVPYSDLEKTFIDCIFYRLNLDNEVLINIRGKIDRKKLVAYLKSYPTFFKEKIKNILI